MSAEYEEQQVDISLSVRKKVSIVWRYFEKLDRLRVRCRLCHHEQNYQGTTGNILRHLKNKHNIDATLKGQQAIHRRVTKFDNELELKTNTKSVDQDSINSINGQTNDIKGEQKHEQEFLDPYTGNALSYNYADEISDKNSKGATLDKIKCSPEEERIIAEIDYFREKAGYYRMQKNLIALQAKKIKYELERL
ncbi:unnamed protein product [Ceratitis capitata]|uniref:(Mediterranean fruit fly) hypothetical protein n=1 Tax=Ceratitis capitata TaxID=7213 RepID=A0A811U892_CERCA|nr:unnamed protein product [Ceratitis capitata]